MGNSQWEREWNGLHNWESRAHRLYEVIGTQHKGLGCTCVASVLTNNASVTVTAGLLCEACEFILCSVLVQLFNCLIVQQ